MLLHRLLRLRPAQVHLFNNETEAARLFLETLREVRQPILLFAEMEPIFRRISMYEMAYDHDQHSHRHFSRYVFHARRS
jgi:hypothetical protein